MVNCLWLISILLLLPISIQAKTLSCPDKVDHVLIEGGYDGPYPDVAMPDVSDNPPQWDFSDRNPKDIVITVHCYPTKDEGKETDFILPADVNFCKLVKHRLTCSDHGQKYR